MTGEEDVEMGPGINMPNRPEEAAPPTAIDDSLKPSTTIAPLAPVVQQPLRSKGSKGKRKGFGSKGLPASVEQVVLPVSVDLVELRYEGGKSEPGDDVSRVTLSKVHKAAQLVLSEDRLTVTGHKGFRSARSTHGVHSGTWFCEVTVTHLGPTGHVRLGWATKKVELQAPVGFDVNGFGYRDVDGSKVHDGLREAYGQGFAEGDVIGLLIHLPEGGRSLESDEKKYARYKGHWMRVEEEEAVPNKLPGSSISFTRNGVPQGAAFTDFDEGTYFPMVSLYTLPQQSVGASVAVNFGPVFKFPPPQAASASTSEGPSPGAAVRAMSELATAGLALTEPPSTQIVKA